MGEEGIEKGVVMLRELSFCAQTKRVHRTFTMLAFKKTIWGTTIQGITI